MFDYFRNYSSSLSCEVCSTKGLYDHCQYDDLDLHLRSQVCLKLDYFLTRNISYNSEAIIFTLGIWSVVDLWMPCMFMLVLMTLPMMKGHSVSAKAENRLCMLSATTQAI